jgi:hypothetical protein
LLKAVDKDPQGRFQTAGQFRDALAALAEPAPTASLAPTPPRGEGRERLAVPKATRVDEDRRDLGKVLLDVLPVALFTLAGACLLIDLLTENEERGRKAQLAMFCLLILGGALTSFGILRWSGRYKELVPNPGGPDENRTDQGKMFFDGLALGLFALAGLCLVKYTLSDPFDVVWRGDVQAAMLVLLALGSAVLVFGLVWGRFRARTLRASKGEPLLMTAAAEGRVSQVKDLLSRGAEVNYKGKGAPNPVWCSWQPAPCPGHRAQSVADVSS